MHYSFKRAVSWNVAGYVYLLAASLISTPVMLSSLGSGDYGKYLIVTSTIIAVSAIDLGLPAAVVRMLAAESSHPKREKIWVTSYFLFGITGIASGLVAAAILAFLKFSLIFIEIAFLTSLMCNILSHYLSLAQSLGRFGYYNSKTFIVGTANTVLAAYLAYKGQPIITIILVQAFSYLLTIKILLKFSRPHFPPPITARFDRPVARKLISFGLKNQLGKIMGGVQAVYAKYLLPLPAVAPYSIAQSLVMRAVGGISQFGSALYPASAKGIKSDGIFRVYHRLQIWLFALGLFLIFVYHFAGLPFLLWWLKEPAVVAQVDSVMPIFVFYLPVLSLTPLASVILDSRGYPGLTSKFALITVLLEILLTIILLPRNGITAPAIAALTAGIITTPFLLWKTERILVSSLK